MVKPKTKQKNKDLQSAGGATLRGKMSTGRSKGKDPLAAASKDGKGTMRKKMDGKDQAGQGEALDRAILQIDKLFGEGSIMRLSGEHRHIPGISTGCLSLDLALGGRGIPRGRIVEIYGPESSGKTTLALTVAANAQKTGGVAAFIDAEHALDPTWARRL